MRSSAHMCLHGRGTQYTTTANYILMPADVSSPYVGISSNKGFVQFGLQYRKPESDRLDEGVTLYIKLPVQVET
eukprot:708525-Prorocentrum_minimum.AAC.1